ncbi:MAG: undecaprenyl-diphosphate phosphatase [Alphaproteobacteria bacterium]
MPIDQLVALAVVQGLTEFLPISSSGHLNLVHLLTRWQDQGPFMDIAVHIGSLVAVMAYFWREMLKLLAGFGNLLRGRVTPDGRLLLLLVLASLPVFAVGFVLLTTGMINDLRTLKIIAWANMVFAFVLWGADKAGMTIRRLEHTSITDALVVGVAQVLSLIPGASRAGVTMSAARLLGFERVEAARFSMLLSIPTILGAGTALALKIMESGSFELREGAFLAAGLAAITALLAISFMMALLKRTDMFVFVAYRIVLGVVLLALAYGLIGLPAAA